MEKKVPLNNILYVREVFAPYGGRKIYARATGFGFTDVLLIFDEIPAGWDDMGHTENANANDVAASVESNVQKKEEPEVEGLRRHRKRRLPCLKILFVILGVVSVVVAIALIIVAILTCIATRAYDADQSSRIAAMVLLTVTAAFTVCMVIYLEVAIFKRHKKPIVAACVTIMILVIVQALIAGISVNVQPTDEAKLVKSLSDSFKLAKEDVSRHYKLWAMTQNDLNCCGVHGPEDYRIQRQSFVFPPDVPVSCCSSYDPNRSDLVQERERQMCKLRKTYFRSGCKDLVLLVFNETATIVLIVSVILIISEILLLIVAFILSKKLKLITRQCSPS